MPNAVGQPIPFARSVRAVLAPTIYCTPEQMRRPPIDTIVHSWYIRLPVSRTNCAYVELVSPRGKRFLSMNRLRREETSPLVARDSCVSVWPRGARFRHRELLTHDDVSRVRLCNLATIYCASEKCEFAQRWIACIQRSCIRVAVVVVFDGVLLSDRTHVVISLSRLLSYKRDSPFLHQNK